MRRKRQLNILVLLPAADGGRRYGVCVWGGSTHGCPSKGRSVTVEENVCILGDKSFNQGQGSGLAGREVPVLGFPLCQVGENESLY